MNVDLTYTNKAGISLQDVLDVLSKGKDHSKKELQSGLNTTKSIDTLLKKLETASMIRKRKAGNKLLYNVSKKKAPPKAKTTKPKQPKKANKKVSEKQDVETLKPVVQLSETKTDKKPKPTVKPKTTKKETKVVDKKPSAPKKVTRAKVKKGPAPAKVKDINERTANITKDHQITALVDMEEKAVQDAQKPQPPTKEVNQADLDALKEELEGRLGKEVTTVLHRRNEKKTTEKRATPQELFDKQKKEENAEKLGTYNEENPFRFVTNFFTSTLNGEKSTPYFRRRDDYVVRTLFNKFRAVSEPGEAYNIAPQNLPFYRALTIDQSQDQWVVKMYHIDMNRIVRGVYTIFKLNEHHKHFITFKPLPKS